MPRAELLIIPGDSIDLAPIRVRTPEGCPANADAYYARVKGHGFPADGLIVTTPTDAGLSHTAGFDVYFAQTMKDFAVDHNTTLQGQYDVTVQCIDSFTQNSFRDFTGSLRFSSPTKYEAIGAAKPTAIPAPLPPAVVERPAPNGTGPNGTGAGPGSTAAAPPPAPLAATSTVQPAPSSAVAAPAGANASSGSPLVLVTILLAGVLAAVLAAVAMAALLRRRGRASTDLEGAPDA